MKSQAQINIPNINIVRASPGRSFNLLNTLFRATVAATIAVVGLGIALVWGIPVFEGPLEIALKSLFGIIASAGALPSVYISLRTHLQ